MSNKWRKPTYLEELLAQHLLHGAKTEQERFERWYEEIKRKQAVLDMQKRRDANKKKHRLNPDEDLRRERRELDKNDPQAVFAFFLRAYRAGDYVNALRARHHVSNRVDRLYEVNEPDDWDGHMAELDAWRRVRDTMHNNQYPITVLRGPAAIGHDGIAEFKRDRRLNPGGSDENIRALQREMFAGDLAAADEIGRLSFRYELPGMLMVERPYEGHLDDIYSKHVGWLPLKLAQFNSMIRPSHRTKGEVKVSTVIHALGNYFDSRRAGIGRMPWTRVTQVRYSANKLRKTDVLVVFDFEMKQVTFAVGTHVVHREPGTSYTHGTHVAVAFPGFPPADSRLDASFEERDQMVVEWARQPYPNALRVPLLEVRRLANKMRIFRAPRADRALGDDLAAAYTNCPRCGIYAWEGSMRDGLCYECREVYPE